MRAPVQNVLAKTDGRPHDKGSGGDAGSRRNTALCGRTETAGKRRAARVPLAGSVSRSGAPGVWKCQNNRIRRIGALISRAPVHQCSSLVNRTNGGTDRSRGTRAERDGHDRGTTARSNGGAEAGLGPPRPSELEMPLHVGQILYDNDPRYDGRKVEIVRMEDHRIICKCGPREVTIRRDRVHLGGERRRSGFSTAPPTG